MDSTDTVRILVALDVPAGQLAEAYGLPLDGLLAALQGSDALAASPARDLQTSLAARLDEFYPGQDGYCTPTVEAVAVVQGSLTLSQSDLRGTYEVGVEGLLT